VNMLEPAEFLYNNLMIQTNVIHAAVKYRVKKLLFLGSSCIYPRDCPQPIQETALLSGPLEPMNQAYATAKLAGIQYCKSCNQQYGTKFITAMPSNLYGPGDNYDLRTSHVVATLIRKIHAAKVEGRERITVWGDGTPKREFLYVDDLAGACVHLMTSSRIVPDVINVGTGEDYTIVQLVEAIKQVVGYGGSIIWDPTKPNGTPRKLLDVSKINQLGWYATTKLLDGLKFAYEAFLRV